MKIVEVLDSSTVLCEIPDINTDEATLTYDGRVYHVELNTNYAGTFAGLREYGYEHVPVSVSLSGTSSKAESDETVVDSVLICVIPTRMTVLDFLSKYRESLYFEELWWIVKDDFLYLFGWWD